MTSLPRGWTVTALGDLCTEVRNGISAKPTADDGLAILRISAVRPMALDVSATRFLPSDFEGGNTYKLRRDDLPFTRYNGNRDLVGACARVRHVPGDLVYPDKLIRVRIDPDAATPAFVERAAAAGAARGFIEQRVKTSAGQVGISGADLKLLPIPLPPRGEQQRIADKLDTVLARVDDCRDRLVCVAPVLKRFRQSVLSAAMSGRLLDGVQDHDGSACTNAPSSELGFHCELDVGYAFKSAEFEREGVRLLRGDNIEPYRLRWLDAKHFPAMKLSELSHLMLREGDVVLAMDRPIISSGLKVARVSAGDLPAVLVQRVCRFRSKPQLHSSYLFCMLRSSAFVEYLSSNQNGSSIPHISGRQILSFSVRLPTLSEQTQIVRRVETLFAFADRLEARLAKAQTAVDRLTPSLLAKAFRGELVPQDPADEPAAELLQRLAAQRAGDVAVPPRRGRAAKAGAARSEGRSA